MTLPKAKVRGIKKDLVMLLGQLIAPRKPLQAKKINAELFRELKFNISLLQNVIYIYFKNLLGMARDWGFDFRCFEEL